MTKNTNNAQTFLVGLAIGVLVTLLICRLTAAPAPSIQSCSRSSSTTSDLSTLKQKQLQQQQQHQLRQAQCQSYGAESRYLERFRPGGRTPLLFAGRSRFKEDDLRAPRFVALGTKVRRSVEDLSRKLGAEWVPGKFSNNPNRHHHHHDYAAMYERILAPYVDPRGWDTAGFTADMFQANLSRSGVTPPPFSFLEVGVGFPTKSSKSAKGGNNNDDDEAGAAAAAANVAKAAVEQAGGEGGELAQAIINRHQQQQQHFFPNNDINNPTEKRKKEAIAAKPGRTYRWLKQFYAPNVRYSGMDSSPVSSSSSFDWSHFTDAADREHLAKNVVFLPEQQQQQPSLEQQIQLLMRRNGNRPFDVIVDATGQQPTGAAVDRMFLLFKHALRQGGVYCVEDLSSSFADGTGQAQVERLTFVSFVQNLVAQLQFPFQQEHHHQQQQQQQQSNDDNYYFVHPDAAFPITNLVRLIRSVECDREICCFFKMDTAPVLAHSFPVPCELPTTMCEMPERFLLKR